MIRNIIWAVILAIANTLLARATGLLAPFWAVVSGGGLGWALANGWRPSMPGGEYGYLDGEPKAALAVVLWSLIVGVTGKVVPSFAEGMTRMKETGGFFSNLLSGHVDWIIVFWIIWPLLTAAGCIAWVYSDVGDSWVSTFLGGLLVVSFLYLTIPRIMRSLKTATSVVTDKASESLEDIIGISIPIDSTGATPFRIPTGVYKSGELPFYSLSSSGSVLSAEVTLNVLILDEKSKRWSGRRDIKLRIFRDHQIVEDASGNPIPDGLGQTFLVWTNGKEVVPMRPVIYRSDERDDTGRRRAIAASIASVGFRADQCRLTELKGTAILFEDTRVATGSTPASVHLEGTLRMTIDR